MNSASPQSLHVRVRTDTKKTRGEIESQDGPTHDLHRKHPHPPRPILSGFSLAADEFDEKDEENLGLHGELGGELLEKEKDNARAA
jgi:hypothetical protein